VTEKREWRRSEARSLKPRPCPQCRTGTEIPHWSNASGMFSNDPDPVVVVSRECTNELCDNGPGL
jgi:hypothetical protein